MNQLIDRYVYDVVRRLPEKDREEVSKELTANILDMLPDDDTENDITAVLQTLGSPTKLAEQYRAKPRYLISPASFDTYIMVLKIAVGVAIIISVFVGVLSILTNLPAEPTWAELFEMTWGSLLDSLFSAIGAAFVWVTIVFAIMDYVNIKQGENPWTVAELPVIPKKKHETVPRAKLIVRVVLKAFWGIFLIVLLAGYPDLIALYEPGKPAIIVLNQSVLSGFIPFIIFFVVISLSISVAELYLGRWILLITALNSIFSIAKATFIIVFITTPNLFNSDLLQRIAELSHTSLAQATSNWNMAIHGFIAFVVVITVVEIASSLYKTYKNYSQKLM